MSAALRFGASIESVENEKDREAGATLRIGNHRRDMLWRLCTRPLLLMG